MRLTASGPTGTRPRLMSSSHLLCTAAMAVVPHNFGGRDGPCITNKDTVLNEVDAALTINRPPDIEVLLTDHISDMSTPVTRAMHAGVLRFGHCAVRYTTSDGKQRVMNILGGRQLSQPNASMVNFCDPCEYLYGTAGFDTFAQQGGAYNRPIVGVRIERVADGAMDAMHAYFLALDAKSKVGNGLPGLATPGSDSRGAARFQLVEVRLSSIMRQVPEPISRVLGNVLEFLKRAQSKPDPAVPPADAEHGGAKAVRMVSEMAGDLDAVRASSFTAGNCAQWTSSGLEFAGLIRRSRLFPKSILIELLESEHSKRPSNVHVVYYDQVAHATPRDPRWRHEKPAYVHPLYHVKNRLYADMRKFADVVVEVPHREVAATVRARATAEIRRPPPWLSAWLAVVVVVPTLICLGLVQAIGPIGPTAAAGWLLLLWWLY